VELLEGVELGEQGIEAAQELERGGGVEVGNGREREAEEKMIGGLAGELARVEVGHAIEVGAVEEVCVEPVDAAFVSASGGG
jgi:hypothetical protein